MKVQQAFFWACVHLTRDCGDDGGGGGGGGGGVGVVTDGGTA